MEKIDRMVKRCALSLSMLWPSTKQPRRCLKLGESKAHVALLDAIGKCCLSALGLIVNAHSFLTATPYATNRKMQRSSHYMCHAVRHAGACPIVRAFTPLRRTFPILHPCAIDRIAHYKSTHSPTILATTLMKAHP